LYKGERDHKRQLEQKAEEDRQAEQLRRRLAFEEEQKRQEAERIKREQL
jgi:hypothetical protein